MSKATGLVRKLDDLGRVVLPKELRRTMGFSVGDSLEICTEGETVLLRLHTPRCILCGGAGRMVIHHGKHVCERCREHLGIPPALH